MKIKFKPKPKPKPVRTYTLAKPVVHHYQPERPLGFVRRSEPHFSLLRQRG